MGIAEEVASKPGGGALAEQLRKVEDSEPDAVRAIGARWREAAGKADDHSSVLVRAVRGLDGAWQGASADAFVGYVDQVTDGFAKAREALQGSADVLDRAADAVQAAKDAVVAIGERALADARRAEQAYQQEVAHAADDAAEAEAAERRDEAIRQAMEEHAEDAQGEVDAANAALSGALGELRGAADGLRDVFSRLPKAGDQPFTPGEGRTVDWEMTEPAATAPQSAAPAEPGSGGGSGPGSGGVAASGGGGGGCSDGGGGGGSEGGLGPSGGPPSSGPPPGNVEEWIREAIKVLQANGVPVTEDDIDEIWTIIQKESGGDPHAINDWDSNAAKGTPSKGLMQCIDPTFQRYKLPGHGDIWNPVDNIIAGVRYTFDRYGGFENHPGLKSMARGGGYRGY